MPSETASKRSLGRWRRAPKWQWINTGTQRIPCIVVATMLFATGCQNREQWLAEICGQESGLYVGTAQRVLPHVRIESESVLLDEYFAMEQQGPIITWMRHRGFATVEVWKKPASAAVDSPIDRVDRYSIGSRGPDCLPRRAIDPETAQALGLGETRCMRLERDVAPKARYLFAMQSMQHPRTLHDRLAGLQAASGHYALLDRETGKTLHAIQHAALSGTRGMFSKRSDSCDRSTEKRSLLLLLKSPGDHRSWWEAVQFDD
jgi:hypothetical protein